MHVLQWPALGTFLPNEWTGGLAADRKPSACCGHGANEHNADGRKGGLAGTPEGGGGDGASDGTAVPLTRRHAVIGPTTHGIHLQRIRCPARTALGMRGGGGPRGSYTCMHSRQWCAHSTKSRVMTGRTAPSNWQIGQWRGGPKKHICLPASGSSSEVRSRPQWIAPSMKAC